MERPGVGAGRPGEDVHFCSSGMLHMLERSPAPVCVPRVRGSLFAVDGACVDAFMARPMSVGQRLEVDRRRSRDINPTGDRDQAAVHHLPLDATGACQHLLPEVTQV
jgi:hypothetical protein